MRCGLVSGVLDCSGGLADRLAAVRGCMEAVTGAEAAAVGEEGSDFISRPQVTHPHAPPLLLCGCCPTLAASFMP